MCGRYYIEIDDREIEEITRKIQEKLREEEVQISIKMDGEIFPTNVVPVQTGIDIYEPMKWGFTSFDGKSLINVRSETAMEKKMFSASMRERRCVIPASGYYEWQKAGGGKVKHRFYLPGSMLNLAACWRFENEQPVFVYIRLTENIVKLNEQSVKFFSAVLTDDSGINRLVCCTGSDRI